MKILIAGDFHSEIHEQSYSKAFTDLGHETIEFKWFNYFKGYQLYRSQKIKGNKIFSLIYRFQNKYSIGPAINSINGDFFKCCMQNKPDMILLFRGVHIWQRTIKKVKRNLSGTVFFVINNDDPFGQNYPWYFWRHFRQCLPMFDHSFVYREKNIVDLKAHGIMRASIMRSYYIKERNYPIERLENSGFSADVGFIGHFEDDGRDEYCRILAERSDIRFRINGHEWHKSKHYEYLQKHAGPILPLYKKDEYNIAINSLKIALVFLSKLNNDTYTRRCFEIPAARVLMLSQYSEDLSKLFEEGKEAVYFRTKNEMIRKIEYYLNNDLARRAVARGGYERLMRDGHEVHNRAQQVCDIYETIVFQRTHKTDWQTLK